MHLAEEAVMGQAGGKQVEEVDCEGSVEDVMDGNEDLDGIDWVEKVEGCVLEMKDLKLGQIENGQISEVQNLNEEDRSTYPKVSEEEVRKA